MIRFYSPDIETGGRLPEEESAHAVRVLRLREGAEIETVDGKGTAYRCRIVDANPKGVEVEIVDRREEALPWKGKLTLAVAPTKNADRMEWLVEKAVEMGVDEIVLLRCARSERKVQKLDRLRRIMVSAMKQSLKARLPEIAGMVDIGDFLAASAGSDAVKVFGYCSDSVERKDFGEVYRKGNDLVMVIGPEGDFSGEEVKTCMECGFVPVTFGSTRMRTETAALYGVAAFHVLNNLK